MILSIQHEDGKSVISGIYSFFISDADSKTIWYKNNPDEAMATNPAIKGVLSYKCFSENGELLECG